MVLSEAQLGSATAWERQSGKERGGEEREGDSGDSLLPSEDQTSGEEFV